MDKFFYYCDWCDVSVCPLCHFPHQIDQDYSQTQLCKEHDPEHGYEGFLSHAMHDKKHCCCKK